MHPFAIVALVALAAVLLGGVYWWLDQLIAVRVRHSTFVVYLLLDDRGWPLYVGQTRSVEARFRRHQRGDDPWRAEVAGYAVMRQCRGEPQARRVERRAIRALATCARWRVGPPIHNEVLFGHLGRAGASWWAVCWLVASCLFEGPRFHRRNPRIALFVDPEPVVERQHVTGGPVLDVTSRPSASQHVTAPTPVGGRSLLALIADAPADVEPTPPPSSDRPPKVRGSRQARPKLSDEERLARRRESNRKASAKRRAAKREG